MIAEVDLQKLAELIKERDALKAQLESLKAALVFYRDEWVEIKNRTYANDLVLQPTKGLLKDQGRKAASALVLIAAPASERIVASAA